MKKILVTAGLLGGVGIFGYAIYNFYKKQFELIKQFDWRILYFNLDTPTLTKISGVIKFRFTSVADVEILIRAFYLEFFYQGVYVGYIEDTSNAEGQLIPANGYNDLEFRFSINPQLIIRDSADLLAFALKQIDPIITLDGNIKLESGFIKATVPIKMNCSLQTLDCGM